MEASELALMIRYTQSPKTISCSIQYEDTENLATDLMYTDPEYSRFKKSIITNF